MSGYRLVAFDLDGTFLSDRKTLLEENVRAVAEAYEKGLYIVPATGRTLEGLPEELRDFPYARYYILVNGACIYDKQQDRVLHREDIDNARALEIMELMDGIDALYDCYQGDMGYMTASFYERLPEYTTDPVVLEHVKRVRKPVPDLKAQLRENKLPVQKMQMHFKDPALRLEMLRRLPAELCDMAVTSSIYNNIEINCKAANKGDALTRLCKHLGLAPEDSIAFGDGTNDITMLQAAGMGIAMANAEESVKKAARMITDSNENAGVGKALRKLI